MDSVKKISLFVLPVLFSSCQFYRRTAPLPTDYYYLNRDKDLSLIGKVGIVELRNNSSYPQISADVTEALFQALQKKQLFSLAVVHQKEPAWRSLQLKPDSAYTLEQLAAIHKTLKCDAVLIGTITEFKPYPHMAIGLRLRLMDLKDGQLLWALEQIWDTADKTTEQRVRRYFRSQASSGCAPLREQLVTVSPIRFTKFVVHEVGETLDGNSQRPRPLILYSFGFGGLR
ncbi:MAG: hypothetical protein ACYTEQ_00370 [Planctomycetota bacterium]|jgi:hypothetical protein